MPDPTLDDVMREAYASASPDKVPIDTLSFYYEGLVDDLGAPSELYVFTGENETAVSEDGTPLLSARLEATAERNAGEVVTFLGVPFGITLAPMRTDAIVAAQLILDSVNREGHDLLEAAAKGGKQIEVTYRTYIAGNELTGPQSLPPRKFVLANAKGANDSITGQLVFLPMGNRPYPFDTYRPDTFKTLQYA
jgi:hypothetical protein